MLDEDDKEKFIKTIKPTFIKYRPSKERPVIKLSANLLLTYKQINEKYFEKLRSIEEDDCDDQDGNYIPVKGEKINGRYIVEGTLGSGSFGVVIKAFDIIKKEKIAIKLIKNKDAFYNQALIEIDVLKVLHSKKYCSNLIQLREYFEWKNHLCLVFEILYINLYELLKHTNFTGVSLNLIRKFAKQLLIGLQHLKELKIIHCDLKPENILLKSSKQSTIKIIDFGSSCYEDNVMYSYVQSRFYRSPEVILGLSYSVEIDMWSLGCILFELYTGNPIFDGRDEFDQMSKMIRILGMPSNQLIDEMSKKKKKKFFVFNEKENNYVFKIEIENKTNLYECLNNEKKVPTQNSFVKKDTEKDFMLLLDLIKGMLTYDPNDRISPEEALQHDFLKKI
eukprot:gene11329-4141_t